MIKQLLLFVSLTNATYSFAQQVKHPRVYYNDQWKEVENKETAKFYRESYTEHDTLYVVDYFINGNKQMIGQFPDSKGKIKSGLFLYFNEAGIKISEGYYVKNKPDGQWCFYSETGVLEKCGKYIKNSQEGEWLLYNSSGYVNQRWTYKNGEIVDVKTFKENGEELSETDTFIFAEQMPEFVGGFEAMSKFLKENLQYSREDIKKGAAPLRVVIKFVVDREGQVTNAHVIKPANPTLDAEALRVIMLMPKWLPGKEKGQPVAVRFTLPVVFNP